MTLVIYLLAAFCQLASTYIVLAKSGLSSIISWPGSPRGAGLAGFPYPHKIDEVPEADWIWDGPGDNAGCNMDITVEETFTIKCLNAPMNVYIAADNNYTSVMTHVETGLQVGPTGSGNNWGRSEIYPIPTTGVACGHHLRLKMDAHNLINPNYSDCDSNPGAMIYAVTTDDCPCSVGWIFNPAACICQPCRQHINGCLQCSSLTTCTRCDALGNFSLSGSICVCELGYYHTTATDTCDPICGDGLYRKPENCDDFNLNPGDGCDSVCNVETNYTCHNFFLDPSKCSYNQPILGEFLSVVKPADKNQVQLTLRLYDLHFPGLLNLDFGSLFVANLPLSNPSFNVTADGVVHISYDYGKSIEGEQLVLNMNPNFYNSSRYWAVPVSLILRFNMTSLNNLPLTYYEDSIYDMQKQFEQIYWYLEMVSYGVLLLGIFCDKVIGIELFLAWQTCFFAISNINKIHPLLRPLAGLKTLNGVNSFVSFPNSQLPERIQALDYSGEFLGNCSYTEWLPAADLVLCALVYMTSLVCGRYKEKVQAFGAKLLREYFVMLVSFNTLNYTFSAGLQLQYATLQPLYNYLAMGGSLALIVVAIGLQLAGKDEHFGEFKLHFSDSTTLRRNYFVTVLLYRVALGAIMSLLNTVDEASISSFFIGTVWLIYLYGDLPYNKGYHNWRACVVQASALVGLFVGMYYRSMKGNTPIEIRTLVYMPAVVLLGALMLATAVSALALFYQLYLKLVGLFRKQPETPSNDNDKEIIRSEEGSQANIQNSCVLDTIPDHEAETSLKPASPTKYKRKALYE